MKLLCQGIAFTLVKCQKLAENSTVGAYRNADHVSIDMEIDMSVSQNRDVDSNWPKEKNNI